MRSCKHVRDVAPLSKRRQLRYLDISDCVAVTDIRPPGGVSKSAQEARGLTRTCAHPRVSFLPFIQSRSSRRSIYTSNRLRKNRLATTTVVGKLSQLVPAVLYTFRTNEHKEDCMLFPVYRDFFLLETYVLLGVLFHAFFGL